MPVGAVGEGEAVETGEIAVTNVGAVDPTGEEIITLQIVTKIKTRQTHRVRHQMRLLQTNLIKRAPSTLTSPPVQAGPVPSTGKKAEELHIVQIPWCVSGTRSSLLDPPPEMLANLALIQ